MIAMEFTLVLSLVATALVVAGIVFVRVRRPPDYLSSHLARPLLAALLFVVSDFGFNWSGSSFWGQFWLTGIYTGLLGLSVTWFELVTQYVRANATSIRLPGAPTTFLIRASAATIWLFLLTNPIHGQVVDFQPHGRSLYHWGFALHAGFCYTLVSAALVILGTAWRSLDTPASRHRVALLAIISLSLLVGNLIQVTAPTDLPFDPTVAAVSLAFLVLLLGEYRKQIFNLEPIALAEIVRRSPDCVLITDRDLVLRYANAAASSAFTEDLLEPGSDLPKWLAGRLRTDEDELRVLLESEQEKASQLVFPVGDPERYWSLSPQVVRSRNGAVACHAITLRDITPQVQAEKAIVQNQELNRRVKARTIELSRSNEEKSQILEILRWSEARYRDLIAAAPLGVMACDQSGSLIAINPLFWQLLHETAPPEDAELNVLNHPALLRSGFAFALRNCFESAEPRTLDLDYRLEDGSEFVLRAYVAPLLGPDGKCYGVQSILEDVTEQLRSRQELEQNHNRLEELVRQRSLALEESRDHLRRSERLSSIGTLAAGVAHQINNPVGAILLSSQHALSCEHDADFVETWKRSLLDSAEQAARCGKIVRSLLQFSRGEPTQMWEEDANKLVHRACHASKAHAESRGSTIIEDLAPESLPVIVSPIQMEQVVVNLIRNAVQSRPSGVTVQVATERTESAIRLRVMDDGSGMDSKTVEHILDPFYTTRTQEGGTGLGLSVAHGIVELHHGTMRVASKVGKGTTVEIELSPAPDEVGLHRA
ncbi:MAG: ATP-binding protein [Myxococcota bacterium]|jgi:PAS domain S-box-containing protein|nr:ATP-binding protein [Myxococcota bacterium]